MRKNRNELQVILEFLKCVSDGNDQVTFIMRKVNITYIKFKEISDYLISKGMIEIVNGNEKQSIRITQKGINFIRDYERFRKLVEDNYGFKL